MATIQQSILHDTLELRNAQGKLVDKIEYTINVPKTYTDVHAVRMELTKMTKSTGTEAIGEQYIKLMRIFFGEENTEKILKFYGDADGYDALVMDVGMMMIESILPAYNDYGKKLVALRKALKK